MRIILQDRFKLLKEGKIANDVFVKEANMLYPSLIKASLHADDAISILKRRNIIFEDVNQNTSEKSFESEFQKFLLEVKNEAPKDAKAVEKQTSKQVEDSYTRGHNFKDNTNPNNISNQQFMNGMMAEYGDPKNDGKTYDQFVDIVVKNLMKDPLFYVKNSAFGIKGIGYTDETPGLKASKTDQMTKVELQNNSTALKSNSRDVTDKIKTNKIKDEMTTTPKSQRGIQKMDLPGKEKKIKINENQDKLDLYSTYTYTLDGKTVKPDDIGFYDNLLGIELDGKVYKPSTPDKNGNVELRSHQGKRGMFTESEESQITNLKTKHGSEGPSHDPYGYTEYSFEKDGKKYKVHFGLAQYVEIDGKKNQAIGNDYDNFDEFVKKHVGVSLEDIQDQDPRNRDNYDNKNSLNESEEYQTEETYRYNGKIYYVWVDDEHNRFIKVYGRKIQINENQELSSEDVSKLFDYHERTGMLPDGIDAEEFKRLLKKYNISRDNENDLDPAGGYGLSSHIEENKPFSALFEEELEDEYYAPDHSDREKPKDPLEGIKDVKKYITNISDLVQNKLFMRELEADDLTEEEAIDFLQTAFNEYDIQQFHDEVYGSYETMNESDTNQRELATQNHKLRMRGQLNQHLFTAMEADDQENIKLIQQDKVNANKAKYVDQLVDILTAYQYTKADIDSILRRPRPKETMNESKIQVGDIIPIKALEDFDFPEGDYKVSFVPSSGGEDGEMLTLIGPDGIEYDFPLEYIKQSPGKWSEKTTNPSLTFSITGDYEGEPVVFDGEDLISILNEMGELAQDGDDFVNKVEYYVTNENSLSTKDKIELHNWYENSKHNNLAETNKNIMENQDPTQLFKKFLLTENNVNEYAEQNPDDNEEYSKIYSTLKDTYKNSGDEKNIKRRALLKFKEKFGREPMLEKCGDEVNETELFESKKIPVSKKIAEIEKNSTTVALESKINAIEEEITRRNNQIKMVDENEDLSELVDKNRMKELQREIKILEKQKDKYVKLYEKQTGKKKQEVVTDATADAAEEAPIEEATAEDITTQKQLNAELENTKKSATELSTLSKESGLAEEVQPSEDELTKMKDELDSYVDMVSNFEEAVEMYISLHPEAKQYEVTLRQLAEPMF